MAAAPELLETLKNMVERMDAINAGLKFQNKPTWRTDDALAAIAATTD